MTINKLTKNSSLKRITGSFTDISATTFSSPTATVLTPGNGYTYYVWKTVGNHTLTTQTQSLVKTWSKSNVIGTVLSTTNTTTAPGHVLVVGGGGGGWNWEGGGAGGIVQHPSYNTIPIHPSGVSITVGGGGIGFRSVSNPYASVPTNTNGVTSRFGNLIGVGGGSACPTNADATWGNGCGGSNETANQPTVTHPGSNPNYTNYGFPGGSYVYYSAGGAGGTGAAGPNGNSSGYTNGSNAPTAGGAGAPFPAFPYSIIGVNPDPSSGPGNHYGGGGGSGSGADGWVNNSGSPGLPGGVGGGGSSGKHNGGNCHPGLCASNAGGNGINNLGGGGGGISGGNVDGGDGGSGLVVLRVSV